MLYSVYGLYLDADPPIPGLPTAEALHVPDVVFRLQNVEEPDTGRTRAVETHWYRSEWTVDGTGEPGLQIHKSMTDGSFRFHFADGIEFIIDAAGSHVLGRMPSTATLGDVATYLTGPVLGCLLRLRGIVSLHASAVDIGGRAVVFVGDAGAGKSTTAAMFARRGYKVITEDIAALSRAGGGLVVRSGLCDVALRPDATAYLYGSAEALPRFTGSWEKRRLDLIATAAFAGRAVPVGAVYLLTNHTGIAGAPCLRPVSSGAAMVELIANVYGNRLFHDELRVRELDLVHELVAAVPVKEAATGAESTLLEQFCDVLLDDVRAS
jgi:hypothetical protein